MLIGDEKLYAILDSGYVPSDRWESVATALLEGGADLLQVRAKEMSGAERHRLVERVFPITRQFGKVLIVNDDIEVALAFPNVGLHLGQDDMDVLAARQQLGDARILGLSTHSIAQATAAIALAKDLDYFAVGPVFATPTKPTYEPVGLELVTAVSQLNPPLPFFCIGGVNRQTVQQVVKAGATRVVAVSDLLLAEDVAAATATLKEAV